MPKSNSSPSIVPSAMDVLGLPGLRPTAIRRDVAGIDEIDADYYGCRQAQDLGALCDGCQIHDRRPAGAYLHHPGERPLRIKVNAIRLKGPCGVGIANELPAVLLKAFGVTRPAAWAMLRASMDAPFGEVERRHGARPGTGGRLFAAVAPELATLVPTTLPSRLAMDGVHDRKHTYTVVAGFFADEDRRVVEFLDTHAPGKLRRQIAAWPDRDLVEVVAIDPSSTLRPLIRELFPNARIVVDKRHVLKKSLDAANAVRVVHGRDHSWGKDSDEGVAHKISKQIMETRANKLTKAQRTRLAADHPLVQIAYQAKEDFAAIYDAHTSHRAEAAVAAWWDGLDIGLLSHFRRLYKLVTATWRDEFLAHFATTPRITTAYVESVNRTLKGFIADGRSQSDHQRLRAQLLFRFHSISEAQLRGLFDRVIKA